MRFLIAGLGILMFAVVTAVLVVWGMRKAYFQKENLSKMLFSKAADKVMHYLRTHDTVTESEIRRLVDGTTASEAFSRNRAVVQGNKEFTAHLIDLMLKDGRIEPVKQGKPVYRRKTK